MCLQQIWDTEHKVNKSVFFSVPSSLTCFLRVWEWYEKIDSILGDTNTDLNELVSTSLDTLYRREVIQNDNESESSEHNADGDSDKDLYNDSEDDNECNNANKEGKVENVSAIKEKAIVVKPHKKIKVRS